MLFGSFPLLTASMVAVGTVVLSGTITPAQAFSGFANASVLLVVIAFIVAQAVVKSGLGQRISLFMVSRFGGSPLGLAYSIVLTDAAIAPAFPSNTARGGVLFPIVLSVCKGAGSEPDTFNSEARLCSAAAAPPLLPSIEARQVTSTSGGAIEARRRQLERAEPSRGLLLLLRHE